MSSRKRSTITDLGDDVRVVALKSVRERHVVLRGLPCRKGQRLEMIVLIEPEGAKPPLTGSQLRRSGLVGIWKGRADIGDSPSFARRLRAESQRRRGKDASGFPGDMRSTCSVSST